MHKTSAWPLLLAYAALIIYASLYPFADWRDQGVYPWSFLWEALPKYWTSFDVGINVLGYAPFGFFLAVGSLRSRRSGRVVLMATLAGAGTSLVMEMLQSYLPARVSSNLDLLLNTLGTFIGAALAVAMQSAGVLASWSRLRQRWFVSDSRGGITLLALWPLALVFPAPVPLGLGQVLERLETLLVDLLEDTRFLAWLPVREVELQPMLPGAEFVCVMLGVLIPCLLGFCVVRGVRRRSLMVLAVLAAGVAVTALSAALSFGPGHAWSWFDGRVQLGLAVAVILAAPLLFVPVRIVAALLVLCLGIDLSVLNHAPQGPYFEQTLHTWEQGRFIRFNGVSQWLAWIWPYATLAYVLALLGRGGAKN
jgi:VanZ family protein